MGNMMRKSYAAFAFAALALAQPASAVTFSKLTTIYVGSGVFNAGPSAEGVATAVHCSNVSGVSTEVRVLILNSVGTVVGSLTRGLPHGATQTFVTHETLWLTDAGGNISTGDVDSGVVNVESRQSAVFCTAAVVDAAAYPPAFTMPIHLVRINPHPGSVE
jgi:hypothetical protein